MSKTGLLAKITSLNHRGEGVGRVLSGPEQGLAIFVAGTVPGDVVECSIVEKKKNFMRGQVAKVVEEGPGRGKQLCPVARLCGGCSWQHLSYPLQLEWKKRIVTDALARIAHIRDCEVRDCLPSPETTGYRNKVEVPVAVRNGKVVAGFYQPYTHEVVPAEDCPLEHPLAREVIAKLLDEIRSRKYSIYREATGRGQVRHLMARVAPGTGERMAVIVAGSLSLPGQTELASGLASSTPGLVSVVLNTNTDNTNVILGPKDKLLHGRPYIEDRFGSDSLGHMRFRVSPHSFYQVNSPQAAILYEIALDAAGLGPKDLVFDVYSGIGSITLFAARRSGMAVGIEEVKEAVQDAKRNAKENEVQNVRFREGKAARVLPATVREFGRPTSVIIDPPRGGAEEPALLSLSRARPRSIVYVSCNPSTLARDLIILGREGWRPTWVQPVDMFPQTPHVETIVLIQREY